MYPPLACHRRKPNGHNKLIHALSLGRDNEIAHVLANTIRYLRQKEPAELTALVEGLPAAADETALHSHRVLLELTPLFAPWPKWTPTPQRFAVS